MLQDNLRKMRQDIYEEGMISGVQKGKEQGFLSGKEEGFLSGKEEGKQLGQLAGSLETLLQLYLDGDVPLEKTKTRMMALLGQGHDELVREALQKLGTHPNSD